MAPDVRCLLKPSNQTEGKARNEETIYRRGSEGDGLASAREAALPQVDARGGVEEEEEEGTIDLSLAFSSNSGGNGGESGSKEALPTVSYS